jgi:hypothetical protein
MVYRGERSANSRKERIGCVLCLPYPKRQHRRGEEAPEQLEREPVRLFGPRTDLEPGHEQERADSADRPDEDMPREELAQPAEFEVTERAEREAGQDGRHGKGEHGRGDEGLVVADVVLQKGTTSIIIEPLPPSKMEPPPEKTSWATMQLPEREENLRQRGEFLPRTRVERTRQRIESSRCRQSWRKQERKPGR